MTDDSVYGVDMTTATPEQQEAIAALNDLRARRELKPTNEELQEAIDEARAVGLDVTRIALELGVARQQLYRSGFVGKDH